MNKSIVISALFALAVGGWILSGQFGSEAQEPEIRKAPATLETEERPVPVRTATLTAQDHQTMLLVRGATEANRSVSLRSETFGRVTEIYGRDGGRVDAGDPLLLIEDNDRSARLKEAKALLEQRRVELNAARQLAQKGFRSSTELAAAQASYQAAEAAVEQAEVAVARLTVKAPFGGVVNDMIAEVGDYLDVGDQVAHLVQLDPMRITAQVAEAHIRDIEIGQPASARLVGGDEVTGIVISKASAANANTRTFRVQMEVENADGHIADGMTAELSLPLRVVKAHFVSPAVLTLRDDGRLGVMAVGEDNRAVFLEARILEDTAEGIWLGGLPETFELIAIGQEFTVEGQKLETAPVEDLAAPEAGATS